MNLEFTETDKHVTEILYSLYMRGYSFADVFDLLNGKDLLYILAKRIKENIDSANRYIRYDFIKSEEEYFSLLKKSNSNKLILIIENLLNILTNIKNPSEEIKASINMLKNDIIEINLINNKSYKKILIPNNIKVESIIYKILQNTDIIN